MISGRAMQEARMQKAMRTTSKFLSIHPRAEALRGKEPLRILDIGCFDGLMTLGAVQAFAQHYNPESLHAVGVDAEEGGLHTHEAVIGKTSVSVSLLKSFALMTSADADELTRTAGIDKFDCILMLNHQPPDMVVHALQASRLRIIRDADRELFASMSQDMPKAILDNVDNAKECLLASLEHFGVSTKILTGYPPLGALVNFANFIFLETPLREAVPGILSPEGFVLLSTDRRKGHINSIMEVLRNSGYRHGNVYVNTPQNIDQGFNTFLVGATLGQT